MRPSVLFLDHVGVMGGAEFSLLDIVRHYPGLCRVVLFADGVFAERLKDEGHDVQVLGTSQFLNRISREGSSFSDILALPAISILVAKITRMARQFDVVYANSQKAFIIGAIAGQLSRRPVVWHLRDLLDDNHFSVGKRRMAVFFANRFADRIIANSQATSAAFADQGGKEDRVHVVYNGFNPSLFTPIEKPELQALRDSLDVGDAPLVGVFSRLAPWKGQHVLIEALTSVPNIHALIVGDALFVGDTTYRDSLVALAKKLGVDDRVHFLGFKREVGPYMQLVDAIVHTSVEAEPFGRVVVEAMLCNKPVIATRGGGVSEIIDDGINGNLVPPSDPESLALAIRSVLNQPEMARNIASNGYKSATARFALNIMSDRIAQHLEEVAAGSH